MPKIPVGAVIGLFAIVGLFPASALAQIPASRPEFADVELTQIHARMKTGGAVLVDSRPEAAFERTHLKGAVSLPMSQLRDWERFGIGRVDREALAKTLPKGAAIYTQGLGPRAVQAARLLQGMGFNAQPVRANWGSFLDAGFDTVP